MNKTLAKTQDINTRILVVDDERGICDLLLKELTDKFYIVDAANDGAEAIERAKEVAYDVVICDIKMPRMDGLEVLEHIKRYHPETEVIMMTAYATVEDAVQAMRDGAYDFIEKPFNFDKLFALIDKAAEKRRLRTLIARYESDFRELWDNAPVAYHTLDEHGKITRVNHTEALLLGYTIDEMVGRPVFDFILPEQRDEAQDRFKLKVSGANVPPKSENRVYVRKDGSQLYVSIDDALEYDASGRVTGVRTTMFDITERKWAENELKTSFNKLQRAMESIVEAMAKIVEMKDPYTSGHQRRVAQLAVAIAREMGLPDETLSSIHMAAIIHDIGKIYVPAEILSKPGKLTDIEFSMIKTHPKVSQDILKMVEFPWPIAQIVGQHHERYNGTGYPQGLSGKSIMLESRILSVADVIEAITFHRPYRSAVGIEKALEEIESNRGVLYDPDAVDACLKLFRQQGFTFED